MNTKIKFTRIVFALVLALGTLGISASAALATPPVHDEYTLSLTIEDTELCSFPIYLDAVMSISAIYFFDDSGAITRGNFHIVEQDTFSANGMTLVSLPYTFNNRLLFDSSGNLTQNISQGVIARIPLPDGSMFFSAGRVDFLAHPGAMFILTADKGHSGNIEAFCAALAP